MSISFLATQDNILILIRGRYPSVGLRKMKWLHTPYKINASMFYNESVSKVIHPQDIS